MKMLASLVLLFSSSISFSQTVKDFTLPQFTNIKNGITLDVDADGKKREAFLSDAVISREGYYEKRADPNYMALAKQSFIGRMFSRIQHPEFNFACQIGAGFSIRKTIVESDFRVTYIYERSDSKSAMLTVHDVLKSKGMAIFPAYLVNRNLGGRSVVLTLAVPESGKTTGMWVATWPEKDILYELYVETDVDSGKKAALSGATMESIIRSVVCSSGK